MGTCPNNWKYYNYFFFRQLHQDHHISCIDSLIIFTIGWHCGDVVDPPWIPFLIRVGVVKQSRWVYNQQTCGWNAVNESTFKPNDFPSVAFNTRKKWGLLAYTIGIFKLYFRFKRFCWGHWIQHSGSMFHPRLGSESLVSINFVRSINRIQLCMYTVDIVR